MQKEQFKKLCYKLIEGDTKPSVSEELAINLEEWKQIVTAYDNIEKATKVHTIMRRIAVFLLQNGMEQEAFMELLGYTELTTKRMMSKYSPHEVDKRIDLTQICEKFGLDAKKTLKEQWF